MSDDWNAAAPDDESMGTTWRELRQRLLARGLMPGDADSLSLRDPATGRMAWGTAADVSMRTMPIRSGDSADRRVEASATPAPIALHRAVYEARQDVCAVLIGGGPFGRQMPVFGGWMPPVFDEQIRQLGRMARPTKHLMRLAEALADGGNVAIHAGQLLLLGMTPSRLALNAELFEKCAKAWVPAVAGGAKVRMLPWLVRHVANGRLMKEQADARRRVGSGQAPLETRGY